MRLLFGITALAATLAAGCATSSEGGREPYDLVVYGGTSGGVAAAVQGARMDQRVLLVAPDPRLGGMSAAGLGHTDFGHKAAVGGLSREFYRRIRAWYDRPEAWTAEERDAYRAYPGPGDEPMWRFEPKVARQVFEELVDEARRETAGSLDVWRGERLDLDGGVVLAGRSIVALRMESGREARGRIFVDASYEGDLLGRAGVSFTVGREANALYGETLNGVQAANATKHQLAAGVDPWRVPGDPSSGLLDGIEAEPIEPDGTGDDRLQAFNYRMCLTDDPANRIPFERPAGYDEADYELLLRNFEAGADRVPWHGVAMPNRKTDTNNNRGVSTDFIGRSRPWVEASYAEREALAREHEEWQRGLLWTLRTHPRVPEAIRTEVGRWGHAADEFVENGNWPTHLYVREGRRLVGAYVMTEHDCLARRRAPDPVGLGAYNMDSHHVRRYVDADGHARNEGDVQVPPSEPYPISYRALLPRAGECENLIVPVCLSASHIAYGSIRMEPVFMVLGQSAATAAALALERGESLAELDYDVLRARLVADGQVLSLPE